MSKSKIRLLLLIIPAFFAFYTAMSLTSQDVVLGQTSPLPSPTHTPTPGGPTPTPAPPTPTPLPPRVDIIIVDGPSCNSIDGIWEAGTSTCQATDFDLFNISLTVGSGVTLNVSGTVGGSYSYLTNLGMLNNYGHIDTGAITNGDFFTGVTGTINNYGRIDTGAIANGGIENHPDHISLSTLNNLAGGSIENNSTKFSYVGIDNFGTINNAGTIKNFSIENWGVLNNSGAFSDRNDGRADSSNSPTPGGIDTGVINNSGTFIIYAHFSNSHNGADSIIDNDGTIYLKKRATFDNSSTLINDGLIVNETIIFNDGLIDNYGTIDIIGEDGAIQNNDGGIIENRYDGNIVINNDGIFTNEGNYIHNSGRIDNDGTIDNDGYIGNSETLNNAGTININKGARIVNYDTINNDGAITNDGRIDNNDTINNDGAIDNNGRIRSEFEINNDGTIVNDGLFLNEGTLGNFDTIDNNGSIRNEGLVINLNGIIDNDGYIEHLGLMDNSGTINNSDEMLNGGQLLNGGAINNANIFKNNCGITVDGNAVTGNPVEEVCYTAAPEIESSVNGTLGNNDWYVSDVTVSWTITSGSRISWTDGCDTISFTTDTYEVKLTCRAYNAGGESDSSVAIKRDTTPPVVHVTGVMEGEAYVLGNVPTASCDTEPFDKHSGLISEATLTLSGGDAQGAGTITATCAGATDRAGNEGSASVSYEVLTPQQASTNIIADIEELNLTSKEERGLTKPMLNLIKVLDDDNPKNDNAACNNLTSFLNEVAGLEKDGALTTAEADALRQSADDMWIGLGC